MVVADMTCRHCGNLIQFVDGRYRHDYREIDDSCIAEPHSHDIPVPDTVEQISEDVSEDTVSWDHYDSVDKYRKVDEVLRAYSTELYGHSNWLRERQRDSCHCITCKARRTGPAE